VPASIPEFLLYFLLKIHGFRASPSEPRDQPDKKFFY